MMLLWVFGRPPAIVNCGRIRQVLNSPLFNTSLYAQGSDYVLVALHPSYQRLRVHIAWRAVNRQDNTKSSHANATNCPANVPG